MKSPIRMNLARAAGKRCFIRARVAARLMTTAGPVGFVTVLHLIKFSKLGGRSRTVRLRPLGWRAVELRAGTTDARVVLETFLGRYHLPPEEVSDPRVIWDIGSNIGMTVAHYAELFPKAMVRGIELNEQTASMARANVKPWGSRCSVITGAAWFEDGELTYALEDGREYAARITRAADSEGARSVRSHSMNTLLSADETIEFLKMDIEGVEREVLRRNTEWASRVQAIQVEVHEPYTVEECITDLARLGFTPRCDPRHWASAIGIRPS